MDPGRLSYLTCGTVVLFIAYSLFVLAGIAINRSRIGRLKELAEQGFWGCKSARRILEKASRYLIAAQMGAFLTAALAGTFGFHTVEHFYLLYPPGIGAVLAASAAALIIFLSAVWLTQIARSVAHHRPNRSLCLIALPLLAFSSIVRPLVFILDFTSRRMLASLGVKVTSGRELALSAEELRELVEMSNHAGEIDEVERRMIHRIFTFSETVVREIMTPRKDIIVVEDGAPLMEVVQLFLRERFSRVLVIGKDLDDVKGVLLAKDLLPFIQQNPESFDAKRIVRPVYFVYNTLSVGQLLEEFRREALHFAVVLDEHGGVDGVVTHEDVIEEIVGEVFDEYDSPLEEMDVLKTKSGELLVDGSMSIDDLNSMYRLEIPSGAYDTLAGFVIHLFGRIPSESDTAEWGRLRFRIEEIAQNRVTQVRISELPPAEHRTGAQP